MHWNSIVVHTPVSGIASGTSQSTFNTDKADFKFGTAEYRHVERCALVSDKKWHKWVVKLLDPFTRRTDEEFFEPSQLQEAWTWACGEG